VDLEKLRSNEMNITSYMTTIVLEKGSEDKELYKEIILIKEKFLDYHHFMEDFPQQLQYFQNLIMVQHGLEYHL